jgi:hypothetical protein
MQGRDRRPSGTNLDNFTDLIPGYIDIYNAYNKLEDLSAEFEKLDPDWSFWTNEVSS